MEDLGREMERKKDELIWRSIPGYDGLYECSDDGQVYSLITNRILSPGKSGRYYGLNLCKDGRKSFYSVHSLIALAFIGERPVGLQVNHIDGDKTNNCSSNLEYVTPKRNTEHAIEIGIRNDVGEHNSMSKLSNADIPGIRRLLASGEFTSDQIGARYGVKGYIIRRIKSGNSWQCVEEGTGLDFGYKRRLSEDKVREIRRFAKEGNYSQREIGDMFGVCVGTVSNIKRGVSWANVK